MMISRPSCLQQISACISELKILFSYHPSQNFFFISNSNQQQVPSPHSHLPSYPSHTFLAQPPTPTASAAMPLHLPHISVCRHLIPLLLIHLWLPNPHFFVCSSFRDNRCGVGGLFLVAQDEHYKDSSEDEDSYAADYCAGYEAW